jgi:hypothetical protein
MAVLVKPNGLCERAYMAGIAAEANSAGMKNCIVIMLLAVRARRACSTKLQAASTFSSDVVGMASEVCQERGGVPHPGRGVG